MPNGRSGGFPLTREELAALLDAMSPDAEIGQNFDGSRRLPTLTAMQLVSLVEEKSGPVLAVEEQDHAYYVIHVQDLPEAILVSVNATSALFPELRQRHREWMAQHPNYRGWLAF